MTGDHIISPRVGRCFRLSLVLLFLFADIPFAEGEVYQLDRPTYGFDQGPSVWKSKRWKKRRAVRRKKGKSTRRTRRTTSATGKQRSRVQRRPAHLRMKRPARVTTPRRIGHARRKKLPTRRTAPKVAATTPRVRNSAQPEAIAARRAAAEQKAAAARMTAAEKKAAAEQKATAARMTAAEKKAAERKAATEQKAAAERKAAAAATPPLAPVRSIRPEWSSANRWRGLLKRSVAESSPGVPARPEVFTTLGGLMRTLPEDGEIRVRNGIYSGPDAIAHEERLEEERRNVRVTCWLYAIRHDTTDIKREGDIQLVLGSTNDATTAAFLIAEIPAADPNLTTGADPFENTRRSLGILLPTYTITSEFRPMLPMSVTVEGSLFFDGQRSTESSGDTGPGWAKLTTVWEIHPLTAIAQTR